MDGINYPICTEGRANCLDKALDGMTSRMAVQKNMYAKIFEKADHMIVAQREVFVMQKDLLDHVMQFM